MRSGSKEQRGDLEGARPPVPEPEPFTEAQGDAIAHVIVELRKQWREERNEAIAPLKAEIAELKGRLDAVAELKGKVDALLTLLQGAKADAIGLPRRRRCGLRCSYHFSWVTGSPSASAAPN